MVHSETKKGKKKRNTIEKPREQGKSLFPSLEGALRNTKIQTRLIISFLIISLVPLAIIGIIGFSKSSQAIESKIRAYSDQITVQLGKNIQTSVSRIEDMANDIILNKDIQNGLEKIDSINEIEKISLSQKINSAIAAKSTVDIRGVEIYVNGNSIFSYGVQSSEFFAEEMNRIIEAADKNGGRTSWNFIGKKNEPGKNIVMSKGIKSLNTGNQIGFINIYVGTEYFFGHWMKTLKPGEEFETPSAYLTVGCGNIDEVSQRLLTIQKAHFNKINKFEKLPVIFNEYCTTWGYPSHENIKKILNVIKNRDVDIFVIDAGWSADKENGWDTTVGDWIVSPDLFPCGIEETVSMIKEAGMIPGIWFEFENCCSKAKSYEEHEHLLKRNGKVITSGVRRFWDMCDPWVNDYLYERVIMMMKKNGFKYIKVDYNETIGVGCDGAESLGEGLRQRVLASQAFFRRIREEIPDVIIENCSSGGHRLEPSMMALCDLASFSDAHECNEIPIIAANLHRVINPCQSQIWAVLHGTDSRKRIVYSIANTFLGVMCLSGDIYNLDKEQWDLVDEGISFYRSVSGIIMNGSTAFYGSGITSYRNPKGWQAVVRKSADQKEALVVLHSFNSDFPPEIEIPVDDSYRIHKVYSAFGNPVAIKDGMLRISIREPMEAVAVHLKS
ncbi:MAG TPA: hypothetical protein GX501_06970 [Clostridiaceae bacterium]|nr:hypothetical protein [Clostridiaceae bacterium]